MTRYYRGLKRYLLDYYYLISTLSDVASIRNHKSLRAAIRLSSDQVQVDRLPLRLRVLNNGVVFCRPCTTDIRVFDDVFRHLYHLPPPELSRLGTMLDLGSNIGLTMVHYAALYPDARIVGVEMDESNYCLSLENASPFLNRCKVIHGAVWHQDGIAINYAGDEHWGFRITSNAQASGNSLSISIDGLIERMNWKVVDFIKMDIEGAEREVLKQGGTWAGRTRCLKVEVHHPYSVNDCIQDLVRLGFEAAHDARHSACVVAHNPALA